MSVTHPVVAITGSSGAGTTSVTRSLQHIFRREQITPAFVEGDSFHRYDRDGMLAATAEAGASGNHHFCHFSPEANLLEDLAGLFRGYGETGTGEVRKYLHNATEAEPYGQKSGTFTPWEQIPAGTDMLCYEGLHGAVVTPAVDVARHADLLVGKMALAMQLILTPLVLRLMERRQIASAPRDGEHTG